MSLIGVDVSDPKVLNAPSPEERAARRKKRIDSILVGAGLVFLLGFFFMGNPVVDRAANFMQRHLLLFFILAWVAIITFAISLLPRKKNQKKH